MNTKQNGLQATLATTLGAVTTVAETVGNVFDTVGNGVGMINRYVQTASEKQVIASDIEMADYEKNLMTQSIIDRTRMNREIVRFLDEDPANKQEFSEVQAELEEAVAKRRAARNGPANGNRFG